MKKRKIPHWKAYNLLSFGDEKSHTVRTVNDAVFHV